MTVLEMFPPETDIIAERSDDAVFSDTVTVTDPLFEPDAGLIVHQLELLLVTVQEVFDDMLNEPLPPKYPNDKLLLSTVKVETGVLPACVSVTVVLFPLSSPVTVIWAVRDAVDEFADTETVIVPNELPDAGETMHQEVASLVAVQFSLLDTLIVQVIAVASVEKIVGEAEVYEAVETSFSANLSSSATGIRVPFSIVYRTS